MSLAGSDKLGMSWLTHWALHIMSKSWDWHNNDFLLPLDKNTSRIIMEQNPP